MSDIAERINQVRERIARAARRAGRNPDEVTLMAVSKTHPAENIIAAYQTGIRIFGESRVQEFAAKTSAVQSLKDARWVLIGHLQSNKTNKAAEIFHEIHSVDSLRLLQRLNAARENLKAEQLGVLVEVNVGGESAKSGLPAELEAIQPLLYAAPSLPHIRVHGLMTIPPHTEDPEGARPYFRKLRALRGEIARRKFPSVSMEQLSMGMSHDFEVAIEEGSTCVRIGTAIFGERTTR
ncbi:MAG TPA: YggS family pyridoxal phosphate-dependent enzyme [Terriglobales bacterium]